MLDRSRYIASALALLSALSACSGDDDDGSATIDNQLRSALAAAGVTTLDPGPQPSAELAALGRALMFDKELSGNRDISCATCHHPLLQTGDALPVSIGTGGSGLGPERVPDEGRELIPRNAPEVFNRGASEWRTMFWDSRVAIDQDGGFVSPAAADLPESLDSILAVQAMFPVTSRDEMRGIMGDLDVHGNVNEIAMIPDDDLPGIWNALRERLLAIPAYVDLFQAAYPDTSVEELGFEHAATAIAAFEVNFWTLLDSPWDRYLAGDDDALNDDAKRGALLFYGDALCSECHSGNLLTDQESHNIGAPQVGPGKGEEAPEDFGRGRETGSDEDRYAFRTPPLRNVALTGPWLHDGAYSTLEGVVRHHLDPQSSLQSYDPNQLPELFAETYTGESNPAILANLDELVATPLELSDREVNQLLAFLEALTDERATDLSSDIPDSVPSGLPVED